MLQSELDFINNLRQSSPYIATHRGKTLVIYLPGEMLQVSDHLLQFAKDIVLLNNLGIKVVLTLGASVQIDDALKLAGHQWETHQFCRVTQTDHVETIQKTIGWVRSKLEAVFSQACAEQHSPLSLVSGNWVIAKPKGVINGIDFQHTGSLRKINSSAINACLNNNQVCLLTPLAYSLTGEVFNLNTLEQAFAVSQALNADKLIVYSDTDELTDIPKTMSLLEAQRYLEAIKTDGNLYSLANLLKLSLNAASSVKRIHIVSQQEPSSMLFELFSRDGLGTLIYADRYHQLRPATIDDVAGILKLISPLEEQGILVKRSREALELEINNFIVAERDHQIMGCAALYRMDEHQAELACLAVDPSYQGGELGQEILNKIEEMAKLQAVQKLFLLTTHTDHWFQEQGFEKSSLEMLPEKRQMLYNYQRQSKILIKKL
ncbi:amino-acid N-acetyltransferase [Hydrogenovibrio marinus]|uniref:Amino-acid acetyltransferase n=1 Tax=Hydrogenovibrio marinus TaxID=28885 RepID=A0A066ZTP8_HYDMR|nr:amino-acid N-acetyltransferase [Hydrogenovibrio marinus]KDN96882.1 N-acetylglutamate synthase [Hydrogenovibrio marinus]BBN59142.1 amino-acid acetyltransferase [Hydrogenovibrio marinus]